MTWKSETQLPLVGYFCSIFSVPATKRKVDYNASRFLSALVLASTPRPIIVTPTDAARPKSSKKDSLETSVNSLDNICRGLNLTYEF